MQVKIRPDLKEVGCDEKGVHGFVGRRGSLVRRLGPGLRLDREGNPLSRWRGRGTVVVPVAIPGQGTDPFYSVTNGATGQLGIAGVAPGDGPYHGGAWQVFSVTFGAGVTPYVLTSDEAVMAAQQTGDVSVTRAAAAEFRCPVTA